MTNREISDVFSLLHKLMEFHGENSFKARSYSNAAFQLKRVNGKLSEMGDDEIAALPGVGKAVHQKILDLLDTGTFPALEKLLEKTPNGILDLFQIKGLGPKKLKVVHQELGVESIGELYYACQENRLADLKGFGLKTQMSILEQINFLQSSKHKVHFAFIEEEFEALLNKLRAQFKTRVEAVGDYRRRMPVVEKLEILVEDPKNEKLLDQVFSEVEKNESELLVKNADGPPITIHFAPKEAFGSRLVSLTGSQEWIKKHLPNDLNAFSDEKELFKSLNMPFIAAENREGLSRQCEEDALITVSNIKGVVHNHSTWSDGQNSVEEMALECMRLGYSYLVMSDHSKSAFYANGLAENRVEEQQNEIDALNKKYPDFKIFKSIECDILNDGSLDYSDFVLKSFDVLICSVHSNLKMDEEKAMTRVIRAIEHPETDILGHPTGRLLLNRKGYPLNMEKIIDACAANGVSIELNANPMRLDVDWTHIPYAMDKGVLISINPDAHRLEGIQDIHYGVLAARKAGLSPEMCLNTKGPDEFINYLAQKN